LALPEEPFVCKAFSVFPLEDGNYDVVVVDADNDPSSNDMHLELALTTGARKGEVVRLRATHVDRDPLSLLGLPGTLVVVDATPTLTFD
jgi:hypothetical protein